jgi:predicted nucleic acid-binding protein
MTVVVDTNIIFSAMLSNGSPLRKILFSDKHNFYAPNFIFLEIFKHKEKILKHTKATEVEIYEFFGQLLGKIHFVSEEFIAISHFKKAYTLCSSCDPADTPFVALSLSMSAPLWSGDRKLTECLKSKNYELFVSTTELL